MCVCVCVCVCVCLCVCVCVYLRYWKSGSGGAKSNSVPRCPTPEFLSSNCQARSSRRANDLLPSHRIPLSQHHHPLLPPPPPLPQIAPATCDELQLDLLGTRHSRFLVRTLVSRPPALLPQGLSCTPRSLHHLSRRRRLEAEGRAALKALKPQSASATRASLSVSCLACWLVLRQFVHAC